VRDLPKSNKKAIDIPAGFVPHYEVVPGKAKVIEELTALAQKADEVILATDPDREGEAIAWHIKEELKLKKPERIVFHEITKEAIRERSKPARKSTRTCATHKRRAACSTAWWATTFRD
jgi:DNA topoisomerase-1